MTIVNYLFKHDVKDNFFNIDNKEQRQTDDYGLLFVVEAEFIKKYLKDNQPKTILEIGTHQGKTTALFSRCCPDSTIYTLDINDKWVGCYFKNKPEYKNIKIISGDSNLFNIHKLGIKFDFIFIDGSHDYFPVLCDSINAFSCINKNGLILWHDYQRSGQPEVNRAINDLGNYLKQLFVIDDTSFAFVHEADIIRG